MRKFLMSTVAGAAILASAMAIPVGAQQTSTCTCDPAPVVQTQSCPAGTVGGQVTITDDDFAWMLKDVRFHGKWKMGGFVGNKHPDNSKFLTRVYMGQNALVCLPESTPYKMLLLDLSVQQFRGAKGSKYWLKLKD